MVRPEGFEPPAYWFEASCSIQLSYGRMDDSREALPTTGSKGESGAPGRSRTSDLLVRSQLLYPAELRAHIAIKQPAKNIKSLQMLQPEALGLRCRCRRCWWGRWRWWWRSRLAQSNLFHQVQP